MTTKHVFFNVWKDLFNGARIWYCYVNDPNADTSEDQWIPVNDCDPRFAVLKSLGDLLEKDDEISDSYRSRYVLSLEEFEAILAHEEGHRKIERRELT